MIHLKVASDNFSLFLYLFRGIIRGDMKKIKKDYVEKYMENIGYFLSDGSYDNQYKILIRNLILKTQMDIGIVLHLNPLKGQ